MKSINLNHLEAFCVLSDTLNFSETAKILQTSQPAISLKIKLLEENLGFELFIRDKKNIALSKKGMDLKDKIYQSYRNLVSISEDDVSDNILKIGSIYEAGEKILAPALSKLSSKKMISGFHLSLKSTHELIERLLSGDLDYILVHQIPQNKSLHSVPVFVDRAILIGPSRSQLKDLDSEEVINVVTYRPNDQFTDIFLKNHFSKSQLKKVSKKTSINSHRGMIKLVQDFSFFAVIPASSLSKHAAHKVKTLIEEKKNYELHICTRSNFLMNGDNEKILESLTKEIAANLKLQSHLLT
ncbi:MAG: LysR family transcriptional regulator [Bdellovibrionales bacterium]|nr:LysR family transcriptional regulator [Bdellovibrionales bacterium]